jgi:hypothetical protein
MLLLSMFSYADTPNSQEQHTEVAIRMIGHEILLHLGDSTSRVLPIEKEANSYRIRFETEFAFNPDDLSELIDSVVKATQLAQGYHVAFEDCKTGSAVHMYEVGVQPQNNVLACRSRNQPLGCYELVFTITEPTVAQPEEVRSTVTFREFGTTEYRNIHKLLLMLILLVIGLSGFILFLLKRKRVEADDPNGIRIGAFLFNSRKMELVFEGEEIELTSKESDLLQLLCASANDTVDRETILKTVWGDDGDYVGRTLDVFVSKLRKKLEADPNVKIANIRGVGYRLVVDLSS